MTPRIKIIRYDFNENTVDLLLDDGRIVEVSNAFTKAMRKKMERTLQRRFDTAYRRSKGLKVYGEFKP